MAVSFSNMPPASSIFAMYASISAFIMLLQTMLNQFVPHRVQRYILNIIQNYFHPRPTNNATVIIEEMDGMSYNEVYDAAEIYLSTKIRPNPNINRFKIRKGHRDNSVGVKFSQSEKIADLFEGIDLEWRFVQEEKEKSSRATYEDSDTESDKKYFEICFDKKYKDKVLDSYIPFVLERATIISAENKVVKLHTSACEWINLEHPSTFDTLAMEPSQKKSIIDDLDRFVRRKEFYRKVGRAWKRGYLLYGPPGTGKSSLIAAMANYLKFDIYDLELTNVKDDSDLRRLLLRTANRTILVIEDIDCTVELPDRNGPSRRPHNSQFTLSGLLNFIDGLWSSCGDERIIVFTTNNKEALNPALLRPGRMDMHIHMSYLTPHGFKLLASTYLSVHENHPRFSEIEDLIRTNQITPAEVAEELMKSDDVNISLDGLLEFLKNKKKNIGENDIDNSNKDNEMR